MPITIKYFGKPSNKAQTLAKDSETPYLKKLKFTQYSESYPRIDKIAITINGKNPAEEAMIRAATLHSLDKKNKDAFQSAKKSADYEIATHIVCPNSDGRVYFECAPKPGKKRPFCRLEFNPDRLGKAGLQGLHAVLSSIMPSGYHYVLARGRVSSIDIAVEIPKLRMDQFLALPPLALTYQRWSRDGHVETIVLGTKSGHQTKIYDKAKELKKHEHISVLGSLVRVEHTLRLKSKLKFADLPNIPNPFSKLKLTKAISEMPAPPSKSKSESDLWTMFGHSVQVGDLALALALLPTAKRTRFRAHFEASLHPLWNPEAIWQLWPKMLTMLGLFNPSLYP